MYLELQYIVSDLRYFIEDFQEKLLSHPWLFPRPYDFIKGCGRIINHDYKESYHEEGGVNIPYEILERYVCKINKGIKFQRRIQLPTFSKDQDTVDNHLFTKSKFLFSNGYALHKYEFGFINKKTSEFFFELKSKNDLYSIIKNIFDSNVRKKDLNWKYLDYKVRNIEKGIKDLHIISTTQTDFVNSPDNLHFIKFALPQIFIIQKKNSLSFIDNEQSNLFFQCTSQIFKDFFPNENFNISDFKLNIFRWITEINNKGFQVFYIEYKHLYANGSVQARQVDFLIKYIKVALTRLYADHECLKCVFEFLIYNSTYITPRDTTSQNIQNYLNITLPSICYNKERLPDEIGNMLYYKIAELYNNMTSYEYTTLLKNLILLDIRPQIIKKIGTFINKPNIYNTMTKTIVKNSQGVIVSKDSTFHDVTISQNNQVVQFDYSNLLKEVTELKMYLQSNPNSDDYSERMGSIVNLQKAVKKKNHDKILEILKESGKWILNYTRDLSLKIIPELLKLNNIT